MKLSKWVVPTFFKQNKKISLLILIAFLTLVNLFLWPKKPPNIILILVDTLRADYLGCYGFDGDIYPHIDNFASKSILFESTRVR